MEEHKYSLTELDNMIPWEREIYTQMLIARIEEKNKKMKEEEARMKHGR